MKQIRSRAMKDSLVDWVGNIPETWNTGPIRSFMNHRVEKNSSYQNTDYLSLMANVGVIPYAEKGDIGNKAPEDLAKCKLVFPGDFVLNSMNFGIGSFGVSAYEGVCSPVYVVMEPDTGKTSSSFLKHVFMMKPFQQHAQSLGNGILDHRAAIGWEELKNLGFPIPPLDEQIAIADFLDRETAQIDSLIAKQQKLIQTLEERRLSLISRAVTYGLESVHCYQTTNSITWPEVPTSWKIIALKHVLQIPMTDGPHETPEFLDEGVEFISAEAVSQGVINFDKRRGYISEGDHARYSRKYFPRLHDIFVIKSGATTGRSAILTEERDFNIWSPLAVVRASNEIDPFFLHFVIQSEPFQKSIELSWSFGTQQNIGMGVLQNLQIPLPPYDEQIQIRDHLLFEISNIDSLIEKSKSMIDVILERRQAIISAAVTGKIDVRGK